MLLQPNINDPRVIRTRKLIMDAFRSLGKEKDIESITVKDIAERATVNRATFYAHFEDQNELLDAIVYDEFSNLVMNRLKPGEVLNEKTLRDLILSMCDYNDVLKDRIAV